MPREKWIGDEGLYAQVIFRANDVSQACSLPMLISLLDEPTEETEKTLHSRLSFIGIVKAFLSSQSMKVVRRMHRLGRVAE